MKIDFFSGVTLRNNSSSFRLVWGVSFLGIFIICNYYTATYTSLVSMPTFNPIINSIEELADSETVNALIVKGSTTEEYILVSYSVHKLIISMNDLP